jgi:parallel beta-helix repeat protein
MKKIKFIFTLILVIGLYSFGFTQVIKPKVQATIKPNPVHPHCVDIYAKPDKDVESESIMGMIISLSITDQSPKANPTITNLYLIPGVEIDVNSPLPYINDGRYQMDFNIVNKSDYYQYWYAGQEYLIATFCFETEEEFCEVVRMQHMADGEPNNWTYWYFWNYKQSDPMAGDLTNYEAPFYEVPGVNTVFDPDPNVKDDAYVELLNGIPVSVAIVTVDGAPVNDGDGKSVCDGAVVVIGVNGGKPIDKYNIYLDGSSVKSGTLGDNSLPHTFTASSATAGTYTIEFETTAGCKVSYEYNLQVDPLPLSTNQNKTITSNDAVNFDLTTAITNLSDVLNTTFVWEAASNPNVTGQSTSPQSGSIITDVLFNVTGTPENVTYTVTPTSEEGCEGDPFTVTVTVNNGNVQNVTRNTYHVTIQEAVDYANDGDEILAPAGTYTEAVTVPVGKALTIKGANAGIAAGNDPGTRGTETILNGGFYVSSASTIDGFTIQGGSSSGSIINGVTVAADNVTVKNSIIKDVSGSQNNGIETQGTNNLTVINSTIQNNWRGIYLNPGSGHIFTGNLIDANNGVGVGIGSDGLSNFHMQGNTISNHTLEGWGASTVGENVVAVENKFLNNGRHIAHYGGQPIVADCNWFGSADYNDIEPHINGNVTLNKWLVDGTDNQPGTPGFQHVPNQYPCDYEAGIELIVNHIIICGATRGSVDIVLINGAEIEFSVNYSGPVSGTASDLESPANIGNLKEGDYEFIITGPGFRFVDEVTMEYHPVHNETKGTYYATIQGAIDDAEENNIIRVNCEGTYNEIITIDKALQVYGTQAGKDPRPSASTDRSNLNEAETKILGEGNKQLVTIKSSNVVFAGFWLEHTTSGDQDILGSPDAGIENEKENVQIKNNIFINAGDEAAQIRRVNNVTIENNYILNPTGDGINVCLNENGTGHRILNNDIEGSKSTWGAIYLYTVNDVLIEGNVITDFKENGLQIGRSSDNYGTDLRATNIEIKDNDLISAGTANYGIRIQNDGTHDVNVHHNSFTLNSQGIPVEVRNRDLYNISLNYNSLLTNGTTYFKSILNEQLTQVDFTCNWFGTDVLETIVNGISDKSVGGVLFLPYSTSADPMNCDGYGPVNVYASNGDWKSSHLKIQDGIDAAEAGDIVQLAEYTFNENVTVDKSLTIQGDPSNTRDKAVIDGTDLTAGSAIIVNFGVKDVTLKNFTVKNFIGNGGNTSAGIYGYQSNDGLNVQDVDVLDYDNMSGFYANGPVENVTVNNSKFKNTVINPNGIVRGIVIWNGWKKNITFTNNTVSNNNCCGIELSDGDATGVLVSGNTINGVDNGIGLMGLAAGSGQNKANIIENNTINIQQRFGIEIKNPNGTGNDNDTEDGAIIVRNNEVNHVGLLTDVRDLAGIAVYRRGVLSYTDNIDIPQGVVVKGNTVKDFRQTTDSDGFGIVVEGMNHTVTGNTLNNNDVGVQVQAGYDPTSYPGDADQDNYVDDYFGRGNTPYTCGVEVSGNTFSGNGTDTREIGLSSGGLVTNTSNGKMFCSIQAAIDDVYTENGHMISVGAGTYVENVIVNKSVTIIGEDESTTIVIPAVSGPVCSGGSICIGASIVFLVQADDVSIKHLTVDGDNPNLTSGKLSNGVDVDARIGIITDHITGTFENLTVDHVTIKNIYLRGVQNGATGTFTNNTVENVAGEASSIAMFTYGGEVYFGNNIVRNSLDGISTNHSKGSVIENNTIENCNMGIHSDNNSDEADIIQNNTVTDGQYGIFAFYAYKDVVIKENTLTGNKYGITVYGMRPSAKPIISENIIDGDHKESIGFMANTTLPGFGFSNIDLTFTNNFVKNNYIGVYLLAEDGDTINAIINDNNITDNDFGAYNASTGTIIEDLTCNWWGGSDLATVQAAVTNSSNYTPWLIDGTDHDPDTPGFQPVPDACDGIPIDLATPVLNPEVCATKGSIELSWTGGTADYTVSWDGDATGSSVVSGTSYTITGLDAGTYSVTVTDDNGTNVTDNDLVIEYHPVENITDHITYKTIQSAINAATENDVIEACAGTYTENVLINKSVTINGAANHASIIDGGGSGVVVTITADGVVLDGFKIINSGSTPIDAAVKLGAMDASTGSIITSVEGVQVINNLIDGTQNGIGIFGSDNNTIEGNEIENIAVDGIVLVSSSSNTIEGNVLNDIGDHGISIENDEALTDNGTINKGSKTNNILDNTITDPTAEGVWVGAECDNNSIIGNTISYTVTGHNKHAIYVWKAKNPTIQSNTVTNARYGIAFKGVENGTVTKNKIVGCATTNPAHLCAGIIFWGYLDGGNPVPCKNITVENNDLSAVAPATTSNPVYAIYADSDAGHYQTETVIATCNWYGTTDQSLIETMVYGDVVFIPYLITADLDNPECLGGPVTVWRSGVLVSAHLTIQAGVDASQNGDVIKVAPGEYDVTYYQNGGFKHYLLVNKSVTIEAEDPDNKPVLKANYGGSMEQNQQETIHIVADDVTLDGLIIHAITDYPTTYKKAVEITGANNATVTNCKIKDVVPGMTSIYIAGQAVGKYTITNNTLDGGIVVAAGAGNGTGGDQASITGNIIDASISFTGQTNSGWDPYSIENYPTITGNTIKGIHSTEQNAQRMYINSRDLDDSKIIPDNVYMTILGANTFEGDRIGIAPDEYVLYGENTYRKRLLSDLPVRNVTKTTYHAKIQDAIDAETTMDADVIEVPAGEYYESVYIYKALTLLGANAGKAGNDNSRGDETIIYTDNEEPEMIFVYADDVVIDGFVIDGTTTTGPVLTNTNITSDIEVGVFPYNSDNLTLKNNIIRNIKDYGVYLYSDDGDKHSTSAVIENNYLLNIGAEANPKWGLGILLMSAYAQVENNQMDNVRIGLQTDGFKKPNIADAKFQSIKNNTIQTRGIGIFNNVMIGSASALNITENTITGLAVNSPHQVENGWNGIIMSIIQVPGTVAENNTISGGTQNATGDDIAGYKVWSVGEINAPQIKGGSVSDVKIGIDINNHKGYGGVGTNYAVGSYASLENITISNAGVGIAVTDKEISATYHGPAHLDLGDNIKIQNSENGVMIENVLASVSESANNMTFDTISGNYWKLIDNDKDVNARGTSYEGTAVSSMNTAQINAVDAKIVDKLDNSDLGLVILSDFYVHNITRGTDYLTIQEAIDDVITQNDDKIVVDEGTFIENVLINKSVTITGAAGHTSIIDGGGTGTVVTITANGVVLDGFEITNSGNTPIDGAVQLGAMDVSDGSIITSVEGVQVINNLIDGTQNGIGIFGSDNNTIKGNEIKNIGIDGVVLVSSSSNTIEGNVLNDIGDHGISIENDEALTDNGTINKGSKTNNILDNTITDPTAEGVWVGAKCDDNSIIGNTISYTVTGHNKHAIYVWKAKNPTIQSNTVTNARYGIAFKGVENGTVTKNKIVGCATTNLAHLCAGIIFWGYLDGGNPVPCKNITVENNDLSAVAPATPSNPVYAIYADSDAGQHQTETVVATCNWYGTTDQSEIEDMIYGDVIFIPYLTKSDLDNPECLGGPVTVWRSDILISAHATIQAGVDAAIAGDEVRVAAGTYTEAVTINKAIKLLGEGPEVTIIDAAGKNATAVVINTTGDVKLSGFKIYNATLADGNHFQVSLKGGSLGDKVEIINNHIIGANIGSAQDYGFYANTCYSNLVMQGNTIEDCGYHSIFLERLIGTSDINNNIIKVSEHAAGSPAIGMMTYKSGSESPDKYDITAKQWIHNNQINANGSSGILVMAPFGWSFNQYAGGSYSKIEISNNTIINVGDPGKGIQLESDGNNGYIANTIISGNIITAQNSGGTHSRGIRMLGNVNNTTIQQNIISGFYHGVFQSYSFGQPGIPGPSGNKINENSITDCTVLIENQYAGDTHVLDATCNWWGTTKVSDIDALLDGDIIYCSIYDSGGDDPGQVGFQPTGTCEEKVYVASATFTGEPLFEYCFNDIANLKVDFKDIGGNDYSGSVTVELQIEVPALPGDPQSYWFTNNGDIWRTDGQDIPMDIPTMIGINNITGIVLTVGGSCYYGLLPDEIEDLIGTITFTVKDLPPDFTISVNNPITEGNPATVTLSGLDDGSYDITYTLNSDTPESITATSTGEVLTFMTRDLTLADNDTYIVIDEIGYAGSGCMKEPDKSHVLEVEPANAIFEMKVFLMGAYSGNETMHTTLNNKGLLPTQQPYNVEPFSYAGAESVSGDFAATVVDWILVSLRDADDYKNVLETKALLLHADGHVTDVNDNSEVEFNLPRTSNYYVEVQHRNHLGIMTATARDLSGIPTLDFTNKGDTPTYNNTQEAQHEIEQGVMAMYSGNANGDEDIKYNGPKNDHIVLLNDILSGNTTSVLSNVYSRGDFNMDGIVRYNGPNNDHFYLLSGVLGNNKSKVIERQY